MDLIKEGFYDNNLLSVTIFHEDLAAIQNPHSHLYGYINTEGKEVIPCKYKSASDFHEGLALVGTNNGQMIIDKNMNKIVTFRRYFLKLNSTGRTIIFNTKEELEHSKKEINLVLESAFEDNFVPILKK